MLGLAYEEEAYLCLVHIKLAEDLVEPPKIDRRMYMYGLKAAHYQSVIQKLYYIHVSLCAMHV